MLIKIQNSSDLKKYIFRGKTFLTDTSFLIDWKTKKANTNNNSKDLRFIKFVHEALANKCIFFRNIVIHQELLNYILNTVLERRLNEYLDKNNLDWLRFNEKKIKINDSKIKVLREKKPKLLTKALKDIPKELGEFDDFSPYISWSSNPKEVIDAREKMLQLICNYGLSSSDAMIANFVLLTKNIDGLITCDSDFEHCKPLVNSKS